MPLIIPPRLKKGDLIGFVSPSAGVAHHAPHRVEQAKRILEQLGYRVKIGQNAMGQHLGYLSGTAEERVQDLHEMFLDPEVKMIMCTIGGNNSNQLLKWLDYDLIRKNPKLFVGYSDITVLHFAIQSQAGLATYYGPCAMTQFGEHPRILDYTLASFMREVAAESNEEPYTVTASEYWTEELLDWFQQTDLTRPRMLERNQGYEWLAHGKAVGNVLGGAILSINHMAGTKYWLNPEGMIYFLDLLKTTELNEGAIDAYLADLDNLGVFDAIRGLIISRPADFTKEEIQRLKEMIVRYAGNKKYPILFNVNIGHTDPILTVRYGRAVRLDSAQNTFSFL